MGSSALRQRGVYWVVDENLLGGLALGKASGVMSNKTFQHYKLFPDRSR